MITYQFCGGRLGENISFIYGLFKFCKNNKIPYSEIKINIDYKSTGFLNNDNGENVFINNVKMFSNIKYIFEHGSYFLDKNIYYVDLCNKYDLASFYDFFKFNKHLVNRDICFCNWWSLDKYWINEEFDFELLNYICCPKNIIKKLKSKYKNILNNSLAVHVRRGDYVSIQNKDILKSDISNNFDHYFHNKKLYSVEDIHEICKSNCKKYDNILFFSDDIDWCENNFNIYKNVYFIKNQQPYEDMLLMSMCTKILGNTGSYFSRVPILINFYNNEKNNCKNT